MKNSNPTENDLTDPVRDQERLKGDEGTLDLPEIEDIPGKITRKSNLQAPAGDLTISSSDEEGDKLFSGEDEDERISPLENSLLNKAFDPPYDTDLPVKEISLDEMDDEGDKLEEKGSSQDLFGEDLDDDLIAEEDEEDK